MLWMLMVTLADSVSLLRWLHEQMRNRKVSECMQDRIDSQEGGTMEAREHTRPHEMARCTKVEKQGMHNRASANSINSLSLQRD